LERQLLEESAEDLYENAPCGYLSTDPAGLIVKVNATLLGWTGYSRDDLVGQRRFSDLLSAAGRIYHETHYAPLLRLQGAVREIAVEIKRADGTLLPALVNSVVQTDENGRPRIIRTTVFDATDRRRYEQELLASTRREQEIANELQRSLLAGSFPEGASFEVGVEYRAAGAGLEVGGDWYDCFWIGDDRLALVVGDVVGRGIGAAATMGQLRSAVRALASTGLGPAALLAALELFVQRHEVGMNTTIVYAELDLPGGQLAWACAGHPPPLLVRAGKEPCYLWEGRSAPIDSYVGKPPERRGGSTAFGPGDTVLLYTDGLVERRNATIDDGLDGLIEAVAARPDEPAPGLAASTVRALEDTTHADDTCLLVLRRLTDAA
jgi:sigma-B regulation protein RsbU (phosphoserine phosphatase)